MSPGTNDVQFVFRTTGRVFNNKRLDQIEVFKKGVPDPVAQWLKSICLLASCWRCDCGSNLPMSFSFASLEFFQVDIEIF